MMQTVLFQLTHSLVCCGDTEGGNQMKQVCGLLMLVSSFSRRYDAWPRGYGSSLGVCLHSAKTRQGWGRIMEALKG